jgi:hypothetical protein
LSTPQKREIGWTYEVKGGIALASTLPPIPDTDIDRSKCIVTCTLTTPAKDRQGEIVDPLGGIYDDYANNPVVFFDHRMNQAYPNAIAMAWESKGGPLQVFPSESRVIAKHFFYQNDPMSMQCFRLIDDGLLLGISLGFNAVPEFREAIGMRPDGKGKAFRYGRWHDLEHTHTPLGVNGEALTIAVQKGRVGSEPMLPMIVKSFTEHALPTSVQANGFNPATDIQPEVRKAMPNDADEDKLRKDEEKLGDTPPKPEPSPNPESHTDKGEKPPDKPMKPSPGMLMGGMQCLHDAHKHLSRLQEPAEHKESLEAMEHVKAMLSEASDHLEGALSTHHPEVKYERPPEEHDRPENDDPSVPRDKDKEEEGEYKVKSHRFIMPRFGLVGEKTLTIHHSDETLTEAEIAELEVLRKRMLANEYQLNAAKRRREQRA